VTSPVWLRSVGRDELSGPAANAGAANASVIAVMKQLLCIAYLPLDLPRCAA
jgi:hypothetical protein